MLARPLCQGLVPPLANVSLEELLATAAGNARPPSRETIRRPILEWNDHDSTLEAGSFRWAHPILWDPG
jgi:hypothetical protein